MISGKTVGRLSLYRRLLESHVPARQHQIFSHHLAELACVSPAQVRRDLMAIGYSGSPTRGYDVDLCLDSIAAFLDGPLRQEAEDRALLDTSKEGQIRLRHEGQASRQLHKAIDQFSKGRQGFAMGIFGAGNSGAGAQSGSGEEGGGQAAAGQSHQEIDAAHGRGQETLEELALPQVHQGKSYAPHAGIHQVHAQ
mgnify:CR=1 FL=1